MKKFLALLGLSVICFTASAHGYNRGHVVHSSHGRWIAPALVGGIVGYAMARQQAYAAPVYSNPQVYYNPPVYNVPQSYYSYQVPQCGPWTQVQNYDGSVTVTRICR